MGQNLDLNVNVKTEQAAQSVGSLKSELRKAVAEVAILSEKFGATSIQAAEAAKKAAILKDRIGDAKALTDAFNPDQKFRALTTSLSGVAGGFAAVQGAMGLFGSESENLQKTLVKVQSAMALSQGLEAVGNSIDSFKNLGTVIKTQVVSAFSTLRGAIIATGVGALAVGLGLLIANFKEVKETILSIFPSLEGFGNKIKGILQGITDFIGVTSQAKRDAEALTQGINAYIKSLDNSIKILESQGGKEDEIYKAKKDRIEKQLSLIKGANDEERQKIADLNADKTVLDNNEANRIKKRDEDAAKLKEANRIKEQERNDASVRTNIEFEAKLGDDLRKIAEKNAADKRAIDFQRIENLITDIDYENQLNDTDFEADRQRLANKEAYIAEQKAIELSNLDLSEKERLDIIGKYAVQEKQIDKDITASKKAEKQAQIEMQLAFIEKVAQFGNILQQIAGKNKGLAIAGIIIEQAAGIASIIINTQRAAAKAGYLTPLGIATMVVGAASVIKTVVAAKRGIDEINKVNLPGGGSGGGMPSISGDAPMMPQLPVAQTTNISRQSINDLGNQAVRAYVIETDVTSNQERMAAIRQRARFS